jgi:hypothetical protein
MLRITTTNCDEAARTFKLEGKLLGPWIGELESAFATSQVSPEGVCLDLHDVTFVDAAGARYLARLLRDGARVISCSGFVAEILDLRVP